MNLAELRKAVAGARVLVVGDVMLDRYWFGDVERISPEAPVPVARIRKTDERAGGAANVARNIAALGGQAHLLAVIGDDEAGSSLEKLLQTERVTTTLYRDPQIATTVKLRVLARQQQLLRIDFEETPSHDVLASKLDEFRNLLARVDVVILSDYGKGGLLHVREMIAAARHAGKPVLVDPKGDDYAPYRSATLLTPNRSEFRQVAGSWRDEADFTVRAQALREQLDLQALLVTRSEEGMTLFRAQGVAHQPTVAQEVFDVSGAGDTVIGTLGLMLAAGLDLPAAMNWSNRAAGVVVGKLGTAVVHPEELFIEQV
ncbi:rfaE bifunctional protein, domain I [Andreprevotia lacus DSM 23236]|jgi:rfaE bifunctional protein kinase chain/domain|uniref:RfaE bifunctional protein, domain I n=1 Tax=Andreprevotia lacus DSM 23236 TaxID=1121001 RepID=A0A1W1XJ63_9NEIS|nr:D-glycero-beta-D-manno-heptose-7-phosphate kinase [Andreprevotia lacus]SMC23561.1 rfaE bifunctional protein, domain I [Andreprevotia lacus DSM 23236]